MQKSYQLRYAASRPQMYDKLSREQKAQRIIKAFEIFFGKNELKNLTLLDIGVSSGIIDNILATTFRKVVGIDIDKEAIKFAKKNFKSKNLEFKAGDALKLSFPDGSFDVVVCTHVYEHVPNQKKLLSEIYRVLRPCGVCYLAAQNRLWPWEPHYNLPFLSWLPKPFADIYIRAAGKAKEYYENPRTYWGLRSMTTSFKTHEITQRILQNPKVFGYDNALKPPLSFLAWLLSPLSKYLSPTFFWLLEK